MNKLLHTATANTPLEPIYGIWDGGKLVEVMCRAYPGDTREFKVPVRVDDIAEGTEVILKVLPKAARKPPPPKSEEKVKQVYIVPPAAPKARARAAKKRIKKEVAVNPMKDMGAGFE